MFRLVLILVVSGYATVYNPGKFDDPVKNRIGWGQLPPDTRPSECVALAGKEHIGKRVLLKVGGRYHEAIVCDCAAQEDVPTLEKNGWALDLSHELADEIGLPQDNIEVWYEEDGRQEEPEVWALVSQAKELTLRE